MLNKRSLDPEHRTLYGANLQPPPGYIFDAAVATTFSLDFETALAVPVSLALFAAENRDEVLSHPLALLEAAERIAGRVIVFTDAGHIQASIRPHSRLCSLLERIVVEAAAPRGGAFHPKIWVLRYTPVRSEDPVRVRLIIMSRNMTRDRSWDIAATLDGVMTKQPKANNRPIADFLRALPALATASAPKNTKALVAQLAEDVRRAEWTLPEPFQGVSFAVNGLGGKTWRPKHCARLGVISPFCDDQTLSLLAGLASAEKPLFIGRSDELAQVSDATLENFARVAVLDEMAITEDGEEADPAALQGLHAKAFIAERGWDTEITIGSGNATRPALLTATNLEIFATLTGKRSRVGSVEEILGEKGFGRMTRLFIRNETSSPDPAQRAAEARLEQARREICRSGLALRCERAEAVEAVDAPLRKVWLVPRQALALEGVSVLRVWPITRGDGHARDVLAPLRQGETADLGSMPLADLTRFLACNVTDQKEDVSILFSTGLVMEGLPAERNTAILRSVIDSKDAFFRYLRLLLSELGDPFAAALAAQEGSGQASWRAGSDDAPILEEMVRALCRGGDQLHAIERLIARIEPDDGATSDPVPAEFRALWNTFRTALLIEAATDDE